MKSGVSQSLSLRCKQFELLQNTLQRTHYPPARIPQNKSAAGFLIRAALTPSNDRFRCTTIYLPGAAGAAAAAGQVTSLSSSGFSCLIS
jgi:hypothetical protein